jgi:DNA-binding NtrC family response regulator
MEQQDQTEGKVLIIDDEQAILNYLNIILAQTGKFEADLLADSSRACEMLQQNNYDLVILDMDMPGVTGLDILRFIREKSIDAETIVLTGVEDMELAVSAMKAGAYDYLKKPVDSDLLLLNMERAFERKSMRREIAVLKQGAGWDAIADKKAFEGIITNNAKMLRIFGFVEKIAPTSSGVLILGESGTGKELIARAIHKAGNRKHLPFIAVNAGAFARDLFASEFFGHTRGAFSGAIADKKGFIEEASGGTLFLDEIGELSMELQVKMLRVLQNGEFFRVGSTRAMHADIRLIAATNKNLWEEIEKGAFRKDLFYRLNVNTISLPPLREREGDIPLLARHFLRNFSVLSGKEIYSIKPDVMELFESFGFPGNVRELENIINSAVLMEPGDELSIKSLPPEFLSIVKKHEKKETRQDDKSMADNETMTLEELEKKHIAKVLVSVGANRSKAAKILGISRITLIAKIKKYKLEGLADYEE